MCAVLGAGGGVRWGKGGVGRRAAWPLAGCRRCMRGASRFDWRGSTPGARYVTRRVRDTRLVRNSGSISHGSRGPAVPIATLSECGCRPPGGGGASMQTGHRLRTARARRVAPGRVPARPARKNTRKRPASAVSLCCLLSFRAALNCCCSTEHIHIGHIHNAVARIPTLVTHTPDSPERYTPKPWPRQAAHEHRSHDFVLLLLFNTTRTT